MIGLLRRESVRKPSYGLSFLRPMLGKCRDHPFSKGLFYRDPLLKALLKGTYRESIRVRVVLKAFYVVLKAF